MEGQAFRIPAAANAAVVIAFACCAARPAAMRPGWPQARRPGAKRSGHEAGHRPGTTIGPGPLPHVDPVHLPSAMLTIAGFRLAAAAWQRPVVMHGCATRNTQASSRS